MQVSLSVSLSHCHSLEGRGLAELLQTWQLMPHLSLALPVLLVRHGRYCGSGLGLSTAAACHELSRSFWAEGQHGVLLGTSFSERKRDGLHWLFRNPFERR